MEKSKTRFIGIGEAIENYFNGYFDYRGTATRAEYWWIMLVSWILNMILNVFVLAIPEMIFLQWLIILGLVSPSFMLLIRRLHDIGLSGWVWGGNALALIVVGTSLSILIPEGIILTILWLFVFMVIMLVLLCLPSKYEGNKYRTTK